MASPDVMCSCKEGILGHTIIGFFLYWYWNLGLYEEIGDMWKGRELILED
jgi:hypothetical protein